MGPESVLVIWNIRGLHTRLHRNALREMVAAQRPSIMCIQETKLHVISDYDVLQILGTGFDYFFLPADQTRGALGRTGWVVSAPPARRF
jgi:exonuclease III